MKDPCLIITTINGPDNPVLKTLAASCAVRQIDFIIAGDLKTPKNFKLAGCEYLSPADQDKLSFSLRKLLPDNNYAKKNLAYLHAISKGHKVIIETDDDNLPYENFWVNRQADIEGSMVDSGSWVNVYKYFSETEIWPRGFSLDKIFEQVPELTRSGRSYCPVQQSLADENPDVDAIYRLSRELPVYFEKRGPVILAPGSVSPFNSQNTTWFETAFPLLYLPSYCSFRACDIWRSFIAQRILWTCNWGLSFHEASVYQKRNEHNLMKDFEQELSGYFYNDRMVDDLKAMDLKAGKENMSQNLFDCYQMFVTKKYIDKKELPLVEAWINDLGLSGSK